MKNLEEHKKEIGKILEQCRVNANLKWIAGRASYCLYQQEYLTDEQEKFLRDLINQNDQNMKNAKNIFQGF